MQTRQYPRTLNEAFHKTAEYGAAIERPAPRGNGLAVAVVTLAALMAWVYFS